MAEIILGKDILENRDNLSGLTPEIFSVIDPEGTNVIEEKIAVGGNYYCRCLLKFIGETEPFYIEFMLSDNMYKKIVLNIDVSSLGEIQ